MWWRGAPSRTTLAGLVHHGASRAFFGPYGGVVMLDGLFLAARGRTLRAVRLGPPAAAAKASDDALEDYLRMPPNARRKPAKVSFAD